VTLTAMARHSADQVREIKATLAELSRSGESVVAFAERLGMSPWTLYSWRKRYGSTRRRRVPDTDLMLVPVEIAGEEDPTAIVELAIGDVSIRVPSGFNEAELTRLLRVIRSC
jgi:transposase-like protein